MPPDAANVGTSAVRENSMIRRSTQVRPPSRLIRNRLIVIATVTMFRRVRKALGGTRYSVNRSSAIMVAMGHEVAGETRSSSRQEEMAADIAKLRGAKVLLVD